MQGCVLGIGSHGEAGCFSRFQDARGIDQGHRNIAMQVAFLSSYLKNCFIEV